RDIDTLIAIVSVIRPGAANTLRKETFARRALGLEPPSFPHLSLEPCLRSTHGVIAYEEHILQIADAFAGMPAGRADILRRALVKVQDAKIEEMRVEFCGFARLRGRTEDEIRAVWELVHGFRGYAFCRAHSTAYALEAWQAAWMKTYHPADFMAAVLTHGKGFYSPLAYSLECRLLGIKFLPPNVNLACNGLTSFLPEGPASIRVPLSTIKGLSQKLLSTLRDQQLLKFASIADFAYKTDCMETDLRLLLRAGALDSLCFSRADGMWNIRKYIVQKTNLKRLNIVDNFCEIPGLVSYDPSITKAKASFSGSDHKGMNTLTDTTIPGPTTATKIERLESEMELFGFTVSGHPLELWPDVAWETYCPIREISSHAGRRVTICGLVIADRLHQQNDGQPMKFLTLCDHSGMLETEMFAAAFRRFGLETLRHPILEITGTVTPLEANRGFSLRIECVRRPRSRGRDACLDRT
ncbi:MAG: fused DNA polymerase IV/DNA polymerase III subunit alpha, partial [Verrucomicrobiota bacterium]